MVLRPELFHDFQELKEVITALVGTARPRSRAVDETALADLIDYRDLFSGLEGVIQHQVVERVSFVGKRSFR